MTEQQRSESECEPWPSPSPFKEEFLQVSDIHRIRYALYGNPEGKPVFHLHGGPGSGSDDDDARWFDPRRYLIITHDQRGSGRSTPKAEIRENTPQNLVEDIERLRNHLNITVPISLFAGSWGSTLALLYAESYPENVSRMILRGIFTCTWEEQDYFYSPGGAAIFSPEAWDTFISKVPDGDDRIQERLYRLIEDADDDERKKWCMTLAEYEYSFFNVPREEYEKAMSDFETVYAEMRINLHYQANRFFLEDGEILENTEPIRDIPVTIIHGTRDVICPPRSAWRLHKRLPGSTLTFVPGGDHISGDPGIRRALLEAVKKWGEQGFV